MKIKFFTPLLINLLFPFCVFAQSQDSTFKAEIIEILDQKQIEVASQTQTYQKLNLKNEATSETFPIEIGNIPTVNPVIYQIGDRVVVQSTQNPSGETVYFIQDFVRTDPLLTLFLLFIILAIAVARKKAVASIIGMLISFFVIFYFILPQIASGSNPILISLLASLILIPSTFFLSHGFNSKTISAIIGTLISLLTTIFLAAVFISQSHLTGFASEEAGFLAASGSNINMVDLVFAGIIIGLLGILDDITIAQSAFVFSLQKQNPRLIFKKLYKKAMEIGSDHIASMINTLILVYTASALSLFLLFLDSNTTFAMALNYEPIAQEIIIMLLSSISLIIAVPITNFIACYFAKKNITQ